MDLSIIIVNYRGWSKLRVCLDALSGFSQDIFSHEVVIVDNNSNDGVVGDFIREFPSFRFILNDINGGFAYGCNIGAVQSSGKSLLFLNPDTVASEDAIGRLLEKSLNFPRNLISCSQKDDKGKFTPAYGQFLSPGKITGTGRAIASLIHPSGHTANPLSPDWISGSLIMVSREFFREIGGFDEDFWMYYEDMDLCFRARQAKGEILYFTDFSIEHKHGGSSRIDITTTALTKTEVLKSKHVYISKHFTPAAAFLAHSIIIAGNITGGIILFLPGIIFFFIPALLVRTFIFIRLTGYYITAVRSRSWVSRRSVNWPVKSKTEK
ncbi:MAG TPA: glycosyltransferase family 2 protein [Bacteroidales bacterium]|nr:glycosyltransferase family 2 protein [Bacteroidales bacterium]